MTPEEKMIRVNASKLVQAKAAEGQAKATRISAENALAAAIVGPEKGQVTRELSDGTKILVKRSIIYRCDVAAIKKTCEDFCEANDAKVRVPLKSSTKTELDIEVYEFYRKNYPDFFSILAVHVEAKPAKTSVQVTRCGSEDHNKPIQQGSGRGYHTIPSLGRYHG